MKQKLLSAALGMLVVGPGTAFAQGASSPLSSLKPPTAVHHLSPLAPRRLPAPASPKTTGADSNANGAIIGAAIGGAAGAFLGAGLASMDEGSDSVAGPIVLMAILGAAGGAGIGYAVDKAHHQVSYKIPVTKNVSIQPNVGLDKRPGRATGTRAGVNAAFQW